jgi:hypothetical protein
MFLSSGKPAFSWKAERTFSGKKVIGIPYIPHEASLVGRIHDDDRSTLGDLENHTQGGFDFGSALSDLHRHRVLRLSRLWYSHAPDDPNLVWAFFDGNKTLEPDALESSTGRWTLLVDSATFACVVFTGCVPSFLQLRDTQESATSRAFPTMPVHDRELEQTGLGRSGSTFMTVHAWYCA